VSLKKELNYIYFLLYCWCHWNNHG